MLALKMTIMNVQEKCTEKRTLERTQEHTKNAHS